MFFTYNFIIYIKSGEIGFYFILLLHFYDHISFLDVVCRKIKLTEIEFLNLLILFYFMSNRGKTIIQTKFA